MQSKKSIHSEPSAAGLAVLLSWCKRGSKNAPYNTPLSTETENTLKIKGFRANRQMFEIFTKDGTLQRKTHHAFASLRVSFKAFLTASFEIRREVFLCPRFVSPVKRQTVGRRDPTSSPTRNEDRPGSCEVNVSSKGRRNNNYESNEDRE